MTELTITINLGPHWSESCSSELGLDEPQSEWVALDFETATASRGSAGRRWVGGLGELPAQGAPLSRTQHGNLQQMDEGSISVAVAPVDSTGARQPSFRSLPGGG
jgi:hypothetical protein